MNRYACVCVVCIGFLISAATPLSFDSPAPASPRVVGNSPHVGAGKHIVRFQDSLPKTINDTVVVPFEYQQSSLNFSYTFKLIDSAVDILLKNDSVTLSIDGYSHVDEANNNICYWLSMNRALAVKSYVIGRGIDSARILTLKACGNQRSIKRKALKLPVKYNCTAEIVLNYPIPPVLDELSDNDGDGIRDEEDSCKYEYGERSRNGCPDPNAIIVPFEPQQSALVSQTYQVLDSVIRILRTNPKITLTIEGHAYKGEAVESVCERLAQERADIVKRYLLSRLIDPSRIDSVKSFGNVRPITAGRNPWEKSRNSRAEVFLIQHTLP